MPRHAWIDASAGIAGDMLLGALLDAGADLGAVRQAVRAVVGDAVRVGTTEVTRAGLRATKAEVELLDDDPPHRTWPDIAHTLAGSPLAPLVRERALDVFTALAEAEGAVHGTTPDEVAFHEVGALDSIADIVGVCAALHDLAVDTITVGEIALGSGHVRGAHGDLPVPVPAVLHLSRGWQVTSGGSGECATPTGMALIAALADCSGALPALVVERIGVGAGTRDVGGRANVTRVVIGQPRSGAAEPAGEAAVVLEANVDDLDPRLWPGVIAALLRQGADDAWLTPILMKKGRPAHTLHVLCAPHLAEALTGTVFAHTSTFGVRRSDWTKTALARMWVPVTAAGGTVRIKVAHRDGLIVQATPEFADVAVQAAASGRPEPEVLDLARAAAQAAGLAPGQPAPTPNRNL